MLVSLMIAALLAAPAPAQDADAGQEPPKRIRNIILFGEETCPPATDPEEVVVCASGGDSPYRIPKQFREQAETTGDAVSWTRRAEVVEEVNRAGLPNSCSPIGSGGQTGCTRQFIRQWAQERLEKRVRDAGVP